MQVTVKEYALKKGCSEVWVKKLIYDGKLQTATMVGRVWTVNDNEPLPKRKPRAAAPKEPKPELRIVYVGYSGSPDEQKTEFATYDFDEARQWYDRESVAALRKQGPVGSPAAQEGTYLGSLVWLHGYKIKCIPGLPAADNYHSAVIDRRAPDKHLVYMLDDFGEWRRK